MRKKHKNKKKRKIKKNRENGKEKENRSRRRRLLIARLGERGSRVSACGGGCRGPSLARVRREKGPVGKVGRRA